MAGEAYNKAHKTTLQALWHLLSPGILKLVETPYKQLFDDVSKVTVLAQRAQDNVSFMYWWGYMEMISILLNFTQAQHDGIWDLHLCSFIYMLSFFLRYDHYNYRRWSPVYVAEMKMLPAQVFMEFHQENFVIK